MADKRSSNRFRAAIKSQFRKTINYMLIYINQIIKNSMKFTLSFLLLYIVFNSVINAQETLTAVITDPQIGSLNGEMFLSSIIEDINSREKIESVVILGNLTISGKVDEFILAQDILSRLTVPVRVVGGPNDISLNEGIGNSYDEYWSDDSGVIKSKYSNRIFLETVPKKNFSRGHIPIEIINTSESLAEGESTFAIFSYYPLDGSIDNWFEISNNLKEKKIISFSAIPGKNKNQKSFINNVNISSLKEAKEWKYNIIIESKDSLKIFTLSENKDSPILSEVFAKYNLQKATQLDTIQTLSYSNNVELTNLSELKRTTYSNAISADEKLFIASEDGTISCLYNSESVVWQYNTNGSIYTSILKDRDLIISMTKEGDLFTINANNGDLVQVIGTGETISSDIELVDLEYNDMHTKGIIFGTSEGNIYCYEIYSLEMVWENNLTGKIISKPLIIKDKILFQYEKENYCCVDAASGLLIWSWKAETKSINFFFQSELVSDGKSVFISDSDGNLHSIDLLLGTETWIKKKIDASGKIITSNIKTKIYVHSKKNVLYIINTSDGKTKNEINLPIVFKNSSPTCWIQRNENLIIGFDNGFICQIVKSNQASIIMFTGDSPLITLVNTTGNEFFAINKDSKIIQFKLK